MSSPAAPFRKRIKKAEADLLMAQAYLEDGAYNSGAYHLRAAADHYVEAARVREIYQIVARNIRTVEELTKNAK